MARPTPRGGRGSPRRRRSGASKPTGGNRHETYRDRPRSRRRWRWPAPRPQAQEKKQLAFVVNAASDFWKLAEAGVEEGAGRAARTTSCSSRYPAQGTAALQNALMDDLVAAGTDAIMISSVDPEDLDRRLQPHRRAGAAVHHRLATRRRSNRIAYLGSSNTDAGVQAGEIAIKALPDGGKCMGFVGFLGADNAVRAHRRLQQGGRGHRASSSSTCAATTSTSPAPARNVDDVLAANPEITCMVGFYSYNPPKIYEALQAAGKLGQITVIAFDEDPITLGAVKDGIVRRHRGAAALRVGLSGHEADGGVPRGRQVGDPGGQADHRADQGHRQGQRRRSSRPT